VLPDGATVEAATVGDEGMVGLEAFFSADAVAPGLNLIQVPDTSIEQLSMAAFRRELDRKGALSDMLGKYAQVVVAVMMQSAACNVRHHVQQRCAKWLLMTHDRVHRQPEFRLSHEFLASMLGASRPSVTVVARTLQHAGLITYTHGRVTVLDRKGLEASACSCYATVREQFDRLGTE
jgi:CRP-like cAMP-binding protein